MKGMFIYRNALINSTEIVARNGTENTPLLYPVFSPESIRARLRLIGLYGDRLVELAGSDAPKAFAANANILGEQLSKLGDHFHSLSGGQDLAASSASKYVGPVSALVGVVGKMYLEHERQAALTEAVELGAPNVFEIIDLVEADMTTLVKPLQSTGELQLLATLVQEYSLNRGKWDRSQREAAATRISTAIRGYNLAIAFRPTAVTQSMRTTVTALLKYAQKPDAPQNAAELFSYLNQYENDVRSLISGVQQLGSLSS
jgi:hypothetical protein